MSKFNKHHTEGRLPTPGLDKEDFGIEMDTTNPGDWKLVSLRGTQLHLADGSAVAVAPSRFQTAVHIHTIKLSGLGTHSHVDHVVRALLDHMSGYDGGSGANLWVQHDGRNGGMYYGEERGDTGPGKGAGKMEVLVDRVDADKLKKMLDSHILPMGVMIWVDGARVTARHGTRSLPSL